MKTIERIIYILNLCFVISEFILLYNREKITHIIYATLGPAHYIVIALWVYDLSKYKKYDEFSIIIKLIGMFVVLPFVGLLFFVFERGIIIIISNINILKDYSDAFMMYIGIFTTTSTKFIGLFIFIYTSYVMIRVLLQRKCYNNNEEYDEIYEYL